MAPLKSPHRKESGCSLFCSHEFNAGVLTVRPKGPNLGQREAVIVNGEINGVMEQVGQRLRRLVIDLSEVQAMASYGLGVCIEMRNAAHARNAPTIIYGLTEELAALFRLMRVERLYTIVQSPDGLSKALAT